MNKPRWIRHRSKWASGPAEWEYSLFDPRDSEDWITESVESYHSLEGNWSDLYRGTEWEHIDSPPVDYVQDHIRNLRSRASAFNAEADMLEASINEPIISPDTL